MKKILIAFALMISINALANDSTKVDTVRTILFITNSNLNKPQPVPGYVLVKNGCVVGYLSRRRKVFPKKVEVWGHNDIR